MVFGPVVLQVAGDTFKVSSRITAIVWTGTTAVGDTCELREPLTNIMLWTAQTPDTNTYLGINLGPKGLSTPNGFSLSKITAGTKLLVYLMEL